MAGLAAAEILALARIIGELDYYELLHVRRGGSAHEVKSAYHATSRMFHPDVNRHAADDVREAAAAISKRVAEAYSVLRDPRRRQAYDRRLEAGSGLRIQLTEAEADDRQAVQQRQGRTPQGRQFFNLACADLRRQDAAAAARNLQMALTFEPDNALFKERLEEVRRQLG